MFKTFYKLNEKIGEAETAKLLYNKLVSFQPHQANIQNDRIFNEIRKLTISDIPVISKL